MWKAYAIGGTVDLMVGSPWILAPGWFYSRSYSTVGGSLGIVATIANEMILRKKPRASALIGLILGDDRSNHFRLA